MNATDSTTHPPGFSSDATLTLSDIQSLKSCASSLFEGRMTPPVAAERSAPIPIPIDRRPTAEIHVGVATSTSFAMSATDDLDDADQMSDVFSPSFGVAGSYDSEASASSYTYTPDEDLRHASSRQMSLTNVQQLKGYESNLIRNHRRARQRADRRHSDEPRLILDRPPLARSPSLPRGGSLPGTL